MKASFSCRLPKSIYFGVCLSTKYIFVTSNPGMVWEEIVIFVCISIIPDERDFMKHLNIFSINQSRNVFSYGAEYIKLAEGVSVAVWSIRIWAFLCWAVSVLFAMEKIDRDCWDWGWWESTSFVVILKPMNFSCTALGKEWEQNHQDVTWVSMRVARGVLPH